MSTYKRKSFLFALVMVLGIAFCGCTQGGTFNEQPSAMEDKKEGQSETEKSQEKENNTNMQMIHVKEDESLEDELLEDISSDEEESDETESEGNEEDVSAPKEIDLIFFMGQSNMSGCGGDASLAPAVTPGAGYEYRAVSDPFSIHEITEPFGYSEFVIGGIFDTFDGKKGSMVSAFVNEYYEKTGRTVVAVSASAGNTTTEDWMSTGFVTDLSLRVKNAHDYLNNNGYIIKNQYVIWLQGESDALRKIHHDEYMSNMDVIIRPLFVEGFTKVFVITPGRTKSNKNFFNEIIDSQIEMCMNSGYYALGSTMLCAVSTDYMVDEWHYNQKVLNMLGKQTADSVAYYTNEGKEMCLYDYKHDATYIPNFFDYETDITVEPMDVNAELAAQ